jgi:hypothetical protein
MSRPTRADAGGRAYLDLQNLARRQGRPTQALLVMYVLERFLARLATGPHAEQFVLKGGMLLAAWQARRATVDADLLVRGLTVDPEQVLATVSAIAAVQAPIEDGVEFLTDTATASVIRDGDLYSGVRVTMHTRVAAAEVKLQLDVSTGDPVTPAPQQITYPTLREVHPEVHILGYPLPSVLAEKLCTAVDLGAGNSRVRDYADLWTLTGTQDLDVADLTPALAATAQHRGVSLRALTAAIGNRTGPAYPTARAATYTAYRRRLGPDADRLPVDFTTVVTDVVAFADPLLAGTLPAGARWRPELRAWQT